MRTTVSALLIALLGQGTGDASAAGIRGDYVEARTADVFTGPCFSNAEVFIYGNHAVMAWKVTEGSWKGVDLRGLCVAAAVNGTTTFSQDRPEEASAVLIVDSLASSREREALIDMAKTLGGSRLSRVAAVTTARMSLKLEEHVDSGGALSHPAHGMPQTPRASFWAAGVAQIVTRPLDERDHACGNEVIAYPPLSKAVSTQPAYTLGHAFKGDGLDTRWDDPNCRSSFVGHFSL
ncbi:MAG: DUF1326 domain-containing protein [Isosphaerales bacterium]